MRYKYRILIDFLGLTPVLIYAFSNALAFAQQPVFGVKCQPVDGREVLRPDLGVENFNLNTQGFIVCQTADGESTQKILIAGALPLHSTGDGTLSLEDFNIWQQSPTLSALLVQSNLGKHPVRAFDPDNRAIGTQDADAFLGYTHSRPVKSQVCETAPGGGKICSIQKLEVCGWNYNRWECKLVDKEVCTDSPQPQPVCHEETTYVYYRNVATVAGTVTQLADPYCPYGIVHRRERYEYNRLIQEQQCCESKMVNGVLTNVCSIWERY